MATSASRLTPINDRLLHFFVGLLIPIKLARRSGIVKDFIFAHLDFNLYLRWYKDSTFVQNSFIKLAKVLLTTKQGENTKRHNVFCTRSVVNQRLFSWVGRNNTSVATSTLLSFPSIVCQFLLFLSFSYSLKPLQPWEVEHPHL